MSNLDQFKRSIEKAFTIVEGEDRDLPMTLFQDNNGLEPYDITGNTEILARFIDQDRNALDVTKTSGAIVVNEEKCGQITVSLTAAQTLLLQKGEKQNFEIHVTIAGKTRISQVMGRLNVRPGIDCP